MPQTTTWLGLVSAIAEVDTFTPGGTITLGDVNKLTVTNPDGTTYVISYQTTGGTTATIVSAGLIAAWNASIPASSLAKPTGSATCILTANTPGQPLNVTSSVTGIGTFTKATTTANAGPNDWAEAGNWSTGVAPGNGDTVYLNGQALAPIYYGLNQSATSLTIFRTADFQQQLGQQNYGLNPGTGSTVYDGQLPAGVAYPLGSTRLKYSCAGSIVTFFIYSGSQNVPADEGQNVLQISGGAAGTKIYVIGTGSSANAPAVNVGMVGGDTGTVDTVDMAAVGGAVSVGPGMTLGAFQASQGTCIVGCAISGALSTTGGASVTIQGAGAIGTATIGGYVQFNQRNGGTIITTLNVLPQAVADFSQNPAIGTVTTVNQYASTTQGSVVRTFPANAGHITFTTRNFIDGGSVSLST